MLDRPVALIAGSTGIVGRALVEELRSRSKWKTLSLSRSAVETDGDSAVIGDLKERESIERQRYLLSDVTHIFYAAYDLHPTREAEVAPNLQMLKNLVETVESASDRLQHVSLMQGSKWYGSHLGEYPTPAREVDPRVPSAVFYYEQQDWIQQRQRGKRWSWSALRPHGIWGLAVGSQTNMLNAIAVYATLLKHMDLPLYFPGKPKAFNAIYQMTDASHLARASVWAATSPNTKNEAFNITNGDFIRWRHAWPLVAEWFQMKDGGVRTMDVLKFADDKESMWDRISRRYGLASQSIRELTTWSAAIDFVFNAEWDQMSACTKAQKYGWTEVVDTYEMIPRMFDRLAAERLIPQRGG